MEHVQSTPPDEPSRSVTPRQEGLRETPPPGIPAGDEDAAPPAAEITRLARPKPPGLRELSPRAILCGLFVAALMGASYPYVVLKLGFGPNVSVVAAILGYVVLGLVVANLAPLMGLRRHTTPGYGYRPPPAAAHTAGSTPDRP
jgi:hypothetical protein